MSHRSADMEWVEKHPEDQRRCRKSLKERGSRLMFLEKGQRRETEMCRGEMEDSTVSSMGFWI